MQQKIGLVVPTIRKNSIERFFEEWQNEFSHYDNLDIFVVEDNPKVSFTIPDPKAVHVAWEDIDRELGENGWIIPRRTDCIRNFGFYLAYRAGSEVIITLNDDCYPAKPTPYLIDSFLQNLSRRVHTEWYNTLAGRIHAPQTELYPRGMPYTRRDLLVVLCHGLWENIPDLDGKTQLSMPDLG